MSRRKIDERTCNNCKKVAESTGLHFGGSPFSGWISTVMSQSFAIPEADKTLDFCCRDCLLEYYTEQKASRLEINEWLKPPSLGEVIEKELSGLRDVIKKQ